MKVLGYVTLLLVVAHVSVAHQPCSTIGITVTKTPLDGDVDADDLVYLTGLDGTPNQIVFARTTNRTLWMSNDFGRIWTNVNSLLPEVDAYNSQTLVDMSLPGVGRIYSNANKTRLYALASNGRYYYTRDGLSWTYKKYVDHRAEGMIFEWFEPNPAYPDNIVAVVATDCAYARNTSCETTRWDIIFSNDGGNSFTRLDSFVAFSLPFGERQRYVMALTHGGENSIFLEPNKIWYAAFGAATRLRFGGDFGNQRPLWIEFESVAGVVSDAPKLHIVTGITSANPSPPLVSQTNIFQISYDGRYIWSIEDFNVDVPGSRGTALQDVFISVDRAQSFHALEMPPPPELPFVPFGGSVFWTHPEDSIFFLVLYTFYTGNDGSIFNCDVWVANGPNSNFFTWSLSRLYQLELYDVKSSPNVIIANHFADRFGADVETVISFNKGGSWRHIPAPSSHTYACNSAVQECYLHLRIGTDSIHSEITSPGFIVANGNVGRYYDSSQQSVFVSLDGGVSWRQVTGEFDTMEPESIFEIADDGSIFMSVPRSRNTSAISYSATGGLTWDHCELDDPISAYSMFSGISTEHNWGLLFANQNGIRSVNHISFNVLFGSNCTDSDYDLWSASTPGNGCVLGKNTTYWRVKPNVACMNAQKAGDVFSSAPCTCSQNDFVCAQCFWWNNTAQDCGFSALCPKTSNLPSHPPQDCFAPSTWVAPYTGYQKLGGSECIQGTYDPTIGPKTLNCPIRPAGSAPVSPPVGSDQRFITPNDVAGIVVGVVIAILLVLLIIFVVIIIRRRMEANNPASRLPEADNEVAL